MAGIAGWDASWPDGRHLGSQPRFRLRRGSGGQAESAPIPNPEASGSGFGAGRMLREGVRNELHASKSGIT